MSRSRIKKYTVNPIYSWVCLPFESFPLMFACLKKADTFLKFSYIRWSFVVVKSYYTNSYLRAECFSHVLFSPYVAVLLTLLSLCAVSRFQGFFVLPTDWTDSNLGLLHFGKMRYIGATNMASCWLTNIVPLYRKRRFLSCIFITGRTRVCGW